jgi:hypothetical protein
MTTSLTLRQRMLQLLLIASGIFALDQLSRFDGAPAIKINHRREDREAEYEGNEIAP